MKLKICGIRNQEMLDFCQENQVDFCGFNFVLSSRRKIDINFEVSNDFKPKKVGIFMNQSCEEVLAILNEFDLDILQFHGDEDAIYLQKIKKAFSRLLIWKAFSLNNEFGLSKLQWYCNIVDKMLFDGQIPGSGECVKTENMKILTKAINFCEEQNISYGIAGGINAQNISEFKKKFLKADFLDTASGVEKNGKFNIEVAQKLINNFR